VVKHNNVLLAAPGETVAVPLPGNINGFNYIGGLHITILANNICRGPCLQSQRPISIAGGIVFDFSPYNP